MLLDYSYMRRPVSPASTKAHPLCNPARWWDAKLPTEGQWSERCIHCGRPYLSFQRKRDFNKHTDRCYDVYRSKVHPNIYKEREREEEKRRREQQNDFVMYQFAHGLGPYDCHGDSDEDEEEETLVESSPRSNAEASLKKRKLDNDPEEWPEMRAQTEKRARTSADGEESLRKRVAALEKENERLKKEKEEVSGINKHLKLGLDAMTNQIQSLQEQVDEKSRNSSEASCRKAYVVIFRKHCRESHELKDFKICGIFSSWNVGYAFAKNEARDDFKPSPVVKREMKNRAFFCAENDMMFDERFDVLVRNVHGCLEYLESETGKTMDGQRT